jgi:enamine deaminase RidA (YjgF/YER057c/UK114 family)
MTKSLTNSQLSTRTVAGTIDAGDVYLSRVAAGGGFAFFCGTAMDETGALAAAALPGRPYRGSDSAHARAEATYLYQAVKDALPEVGSSIADVVQVEQYVRLKNHADGYFAAALGADLLGTGTANGATAQVGTFAPADASISVSGLAVVPDTAGHPKTFPGAGGSPTGKFADPVAAGPYLFTTMFAMDRKAEGLPADVKVPGWSWNESEIRSETKWAIRQLEAKLAPLGAGLADVVDYTVFLADLGDLYEFDLLMREAIAGRPGGHSTGAPARTVMHLRGSALPRREGAFGHDEGAARLEVQFRCLIPGRGTHRVLLGAPTADTGYQSAGVRAGSLLWLSSQCASESALGDGAREIADVLGQLEATCADAGTSLRQLLRARVQVTDPKLIPEFFAALRRAVPTEPPAVSVVVTDALTVQGAGVAIDGVAVVGS